VDLYKRANPLPGARAKVPLLQILEETGEEEGNEKKKDDVVLCESLVVAEYVAEVYSKQEGGNYKGNILPHTPKDRATMRLFTELCGSSLSYFPLLRVLGNAEEFESALSKFKEDLVSVDAFLSSMSVGGEGPFLFGSQFTLAECNTAPFVSRCCTVLPAFTSKSDDTVVDPMTICDEMGLNRLKQWMDAVIQRPSVIATGVAKDDMIQSTSNMLERFKAMAS